MKTSRERQQFIASVKRSTSDYSIEEVLKETISHFDLLHAVYHAKSLLRLTDQAPYLQLTYPDSWVSLYFAKGYFQIDPVVAQAETATEPFNWDSLDWSCPKASDFKKLSEKHGVGRTGFSVPIKGRYGEQALFSVSSDLDEKEWRMYLHNAGDDLKNLAMAIHDKVLDIEDVRLTNSLRPLSRKEVEVLQLSADGLTVQQIAEQLDITERAVRNRLDSARKKLGATNRTNAVAIAISMGLIKPPKNTPI